MLPLYSTSYRWALFLLVGSSLGACQRAAFQFQPVATAPYLIAATMQKPDEPLAVPRRQAAALVPVAARPRRVRHPRHLARAVSTSNAASFHGLHRSAVSATLTASGFSQQQPTTPPKSERHRLRGIALILAFLSFTYVPLSLHNFYLGYYGRGAAAIGLLLAGLFLLLIGWPSFLFSGSLTFVGALGLAILGGWFLWQLSDFIRIISRDLQPKDGSYGK